jgi:hypothetical protein
VADELMISRAACWSCSSHSTLGTVESVYRHHREAAKSRALMPDSPSASVTWVVRSAR